MQKEITKKVLLRGIRPIMFDRYPGDNKTKLPPEEKFYFAADGKGLVLPAKNILSLLGAQNKTSAAKNLYGKGYKNICRAVYGSLGIEPILIPILRDGKPTVFGGFSEKKGLVIDVDKAITKQGTPNVVERPIIELPWELAFTVTLYPNVDGLRETDLRAMFEHGGLSIGLGTFHGAYGKFVIEKWE